MARCVGRRVSVGMVQDVIMLLGNAAALLAGSGYSATSVCNYRGLTQNTCIPKNQRSATLSFYLVHSLNVS